MSPAGRRDLQAAAEPATPVAAERAPAGPEPYRELSRLAGNRAVEQLLGDLITPSGPGVVLAPALRGTLESAFGRDLGHVRIHEGPEARATTALLGARAFTAGRDVWLGADAAGDTALLGHEVAHVIQQGGAPPAARIAPAAGAAEHAAAQAGEAVATGQPAGPVGTAPAGVQLAVEPRRRQPAELASWPEEAASRAVTVGAQPPAGSAEAQTIDPAGLQSRPIEGARISMTAASVGAVATSELEAQVATLRGQMRGLEKDAPLRATTRANLAILEAEMMRRGQSSVSTVAPAGARGESVAGMDLATRFARSVTYAGEYVGPDLWEQLKQLLSPESLAVMVLFCAAQFFVAGELADMAGFYLLARKIGADALTVVSDLEEFFSLDLAAHDDRDLRKAGEHLAHAITLAGVDALLLFLAARDKGSAKGLARPGRSEPVGKPPAPPRDVEPGTGQAPPPPNTAPTTEPVSGGGAAKAPESPSEQVVSKEPAAEPQLAKAPESPSEQLVSKEPAAEPQPAKAPESPSEQLVSKEPAAEPQPAKAPESPSEQLASKEPAAEPQPAKAPESPSEQLASKEPAAEGGRRRRRSRLQKRPARFRGSCSRLRAARRRGVSRRFRRRRWRWHASSLHFATYPTD